MNEREMTDLPDAELLDWARQCQATGRWRAPPRPQSHMPIEQYRQIIRAKRDDRRDAARELRAAGKSWREVGLSLGVSPRRAALIARMEPTRPYYPPKERLSPNELAISKLDTNAIVKSTLKLAGYRTIGDLKSAIDKEGPDVIAAKLLELPNFGRQSLVKLRMALALADPDFRMMGLK